ncbi:hypothetical protein [Actinomadura parmotrematis]|uniref:DivIVA domain-containing protein n=1 Tax=Actinomadura parmotrematis TaxID=2864039 RepID=A0ABS7FX97_9ACTN|nr:hypothetical protein [Actinomadura parmotrematis]MBW8485046.1 hypothetical protein [Actinomadura parmotrematis]
MAFALIVLLLVAGWLVLVRTRRVSFPAELPPGGAANAAGPPPGPKGPDDDPEFLRDLDRRLRGEDQP